MATRRYYSATAVDNTVSSGINSSATSVTLSNSPVGYPSTFPFVVALDYNNASEELVLVTASSGTTLTITRGYGGSSGTAHNAGAVVRHVIIAQDLTDFQDHAAATTAHGVSGTLVGTSDTQTLTNKTIDYNSNTISNLPTYNPTISFNAQTGTTYTLVSGDVNKLVTLSNAGSITLTIPSGVFAAGQIVNIQAIGVGQVTVQGNGTSTVTSTPGLKLRGQYSAATLICTGTNTFTLVGDLSA